MNLFAVVYKNHVIVGPSRWNAKKFKQEIFDECEVEVELPDTNDQKQVFLFWTFFFDTWNCLEPGVYTCCFKIK